MPSYQQALKAVPSVLGASSAETAGLSERLKEADATARAAGFSVLPVPQVVLGPVQWQRVAAAGPLGPILQAAFEAQAAARTSELRSLLALLNGAAAREAAKALRLSGED